MTKNVGIFLALYVGKHEQLQSAILEKNGNLDLDGSVDLSDVDDEQYEGWQSQQERALKRKSGLRRVHRGEEG